MSQMSSGPQNMRMRPKQSPYSSDPANEPLATSPAGVAQGASYPEYYAGTRMRTGYVSAPGNAEYNRLTGGGRMTKPLSTYVPPSAPPPIMPSAVPPTPEPRTVPTNPVSSTPMSSMRAGAVGSDFVPASAVPRDFLANTPRQTPQQQQFSLPQTAPVDQSRSQVPSMYMPVLAGGTPGRPRQTEDEARMSAIRSQTAQRAERYGQQLAPALREKYPTEQTVRGDLRAATTPGTPVDQNAAFGVLRGRADQPGESAYRLNWDSVRGLTPDQQEILRSQGRIDYGPSVPQMPATPTQRIVSSEERTRRDQALAQLRAENAPAVPTQARPAGLGGTQASAVPTMPTGQTVEQQQAQQRREKYAQWRDTPEGRRLTQNAENARQIRMSPVARAREAEATNRADAVAREQRALAAQQAQRQAESDLVREGYRSRERQSEIEAGGRTAAAQAGIAGDEAKREEQRRQFVAGKVADFARNRDPITGQLPSAQEVDAFRNRFMQEYTGLGGTTTRAPQQPEEPMLDRNTPPQPNSVYRLPGREGSWRFNGQEFERVR